LFQDKRYNINLKKFKTLNYILHNIRSTKQKRQIGTINLISAKNFAFTHVVNYLHKL